MEDLVALIWGGLEEGVENVFKVGSCREQGPAVEQLLWLLGGEPKGSVDADSWWHAEDAVERKLQAVGAAEAMFACGGVRALLHVLRTPVRLILITPMKYLRI